MKIRDRQMVVAERLTSGRCQTYEEYKLQIGKLQGLKESEEVVMEVYKATFKTQILEERSTENDRTDAIEFY